MRKLFIFLMVLSLIFMSVAPSVFGAYANVGPTTEFQGDVGTTGDFLVNGTKIALTDLTTSGLIDEAMFDADAPSSGDILTYDGGGTDFLWKTAAELNLTVTTGTPSNSQIAVWTADGIIEGAADLTYDGANLQFTGDLGSTGTKITKGWFTDLEVANDIAGSITGNAETVTFIDNDTTNEANEILFAGNAASSGDAVLEADSDFTYNPSTGTVTATIFSATDYFTGEIRLVTSDADPDTTGEIKHDSTVATMSGGALRWFDDNTSRMIVDLETDATDDDFVVAYDADADGFYMKEDASVAGNYVLHLMDMDAADTEYLIVDATGDADKIGDIVAMPDFARNITTTGTVAGGTVTITGTTADGTVGATDAIDVANGFTAGEKAFLTITNIVLAGTTGTIDVGIGDLIGLPNSINGVTDVYYLTIDGVGSFGSITGNVNTTFNTIDLSVTQNSDYTIYYHN